MKIAVVFGSQRFSSHNRVGKSKEIEEMLTDLNLPHELDFIRMADANIFGCKHCWGCEGKNACVVDDDFNSIRKRLIAADAIFLIVPVYALIPSKLTAVLEKLTSSSYINSLLSTENTPLHGKKVAIFTYCSCFICEDVTLKAILRKFLVADERTGFYKFLTDEYMYNEHAAYSLTYSGLGPDNIFNHDIVEYVKNVALWLK